MTTYTLTPALREWFAAREQVVALDAALASIKNEYMAIDALPDAEWREAYDALQAREREIGRAHVDAVDAGHRVLRSLDDNERAALKDKTAVFVEPEPVIDSDWPETYTCGSDMTVSDAIAYLASGRTDQASVRTIAIELVARALDIALTDDYDANYDKIYDWIADGSFSGYETIASLADEWRELDAQARAATRG